MNTSQEFKFSPTVVIFPIGFVLMMWLVFWFEIRFGFDFNYLGIRPGKLFGLRGVLFGPFIHSNLQHLFNNSIPLFILLMALFYFYRALSLKVLVYGLLLTGILTWVIGRPANHIGASGIIYMLVSFLFFKGLFSKHYRLMALSFMVIFLYGSLIWYVFPVDSKISWEGHLSGFFVGFVFAFLFKNNIVKPPRYDWEKDDFNPEDDDFLKHFDESGNFIESKKEDDVLKSDDDIS